jgi:hypothetical protein
MSYADDDEDIAGEIAQLLSGDQVQVYPRQSVLERCMSRALEGVIGQADAFLALMSPSFLGSSPCRRERDLALNWGRADFIQVLEVRTTPYPEDGPLSGRPWFDMTTPHGWQTALSQLVRGLTTAGVAALTPAAAGLRHETPDFRNREDELERVVTGLTGVDGKDCWLVIAPPQLGKSWFLDRVSIEVHSREPGRWTVRLVDVREQPRHIRASAEALLGLMFGSQDPVSTDPGSLRQLANGVIEAGKRYLCLLDGADLLDRQTAETLRSYMSQMYSLVDEAGSADVRPALIVASRREEWPGVSKPRLAQLPLTEFKSDVMVDALGNMSVRMKRNLSQAELARRAKVVHGLSEGLPALLYKYLDWIRRNNLIGLDSLREKAQFDELSEPYIKRDLISPNSLFGSGPAPSDDEFACVEQALRVLVRYRLFTHSHLLHHAKSPGSLPDSMRTVGWSVERLWAAVSGTDLLQRPQREPWHEIYAPIRRLLFRYWYTSEINLADAHRSAGRFVRSWAEGQTGSDQSVVLVECLWHESQVLKLSRAMDAEERLTRVARQMSEDLVASAWTQETLRQYAVTRMRKDDELADAVEEIGVSFDSLVDAVLQGGQGGHGDEV